MIGLRRFIVALTGVLGVIAVEIVAIVFYSKVGVSAVVGISMAGSAALVAIVGSYVGTSAWAKRGEHAGEELKP